MIVKPNPATNQITLFIGNHKIVNTIQVFVYSVQGLLMDNFTLKAESRNELEINTSKYPNGVYIIHSLADDGKVNAQKLIIQK